MARGTAIAKLSKFSTEPLPTRTLVATHAWHDHSLEIGLSDQLPHDAGKTVARWPYATPYAATFRNIENCLHEMREMNG
jgi:hypothetical protein